MPARQAAGPRLQPVLSGSVLPALAAALAGGSPIAPIPADALEASRTLEMLQPTMDVTEADAAAIVSTSGSTGRPKGVVLSRAAIMASVRATHQRLGGDGTWVRALPDHYVAGLMVLARSIVAGTLPVTVLADLSDLRQQVEGVSGRRYLSLVPTQLGRALAHPQLCATLAGFDAVLIGGAAASGELLQAASVAGVKIVTTYGMSETCGGCVYDGVPLADVVIELDPDSARISIGGPVVFSGYRLQPELTAQTLRRGRLITNDRGTFTDYQLSLLGRIDEVVMSGGLNIDLAEVQSVASSWPALEGAEIAIIGVPDPQWGTRVVAVAEEGAGDFSELRRFLADALPAYAAPRQLFRVPSLPRTSSGKIDRQRLAAEASNRDDQITAPPMTGEA